MLTSPSGRPIRRSAATARTVTAQLLENLDASDDEVLGPGDGSAPSAGSTNPAAESLLDPISLSENSAGSPSGSDSAAEGARRSAKARSLHAAIFGSDDEMSDESLPPSQILKDYLGLGSSEDDEKEGSDWSDGSGPPIRSFLKRTLSTGPYSFTPDDDDDDDDDEDESPEDSEEARVADDALEEGTRPGTAGSAIQIDSDGGSDSDGGGGSPHGGGSPGSVLMPAPPNSSLPGMLPVAPFGPDAAFIPGRRAPVAFATRDIEPWSAKKLNRVAIISMKITVLFPELPFRTEWIFPREADVIPTAGYVDSLVTRSHVEELHDAAPWDTLTTTLVDPE
ncbi:hypothetical protein PInf_026511 [Phytophthora infestans]|nr:hypothetical protein PInf_026511 [Phytophthora infestans]